MSIRHTRVAIFAILLFTLPLLAQQTIVVRGADSMLLLAQQWSARLRIIYPRAQLLAYGGGVNNSLNLMAAGRADIVQSQRKISIKERANLESRIGHPVLEFPVGIEMVAASVNGLNPVSDLSVAQLRDIYAGKIENWAQVGGPNHRIQLYSVESPAGGSLFFQEIAMGGSEIDYSMRGFSYAKQMSDALATDPYGVGIGPIITRANVKTLRVRRGSGSAGVAPNMSTIGSESYPLARHIYWIARLPMTEEVRKISGWVLSSEGQLSVEGVGYYPLNAQDRASAAGQIFQAK